MTSRIVDHLPQSERSSGGMEKLIAGEGSVLDRDGNLTAKATGTFKVTGRSIGRERHDKDD